MEFPKWFSELVDEYKPSAAKRSDRALARFVRIMSKHYEPEVLADAVDEFILSNESGFFPSVGEFRPYANRAAERARAHVGVGAVDVKILRFEQERGTMPPNEQLGTDYLTWED